MDRRVSGRLRYLHVLSSVPLGPHPTWDSVSPGLPSLGPTKLLVDFLGASGSRGRNPWNRTPSLPSFSPQGTRRSGTPEAQSGRRRILGKRHAALGTDRILTPTLQLPPRLALSPTDSPPRPPRRAGAGLAALSSSADSPGASPGLQGLGTVPSGWRLAGWLPLRSRQQLPASQAGSRRAGEHGEEGGRWRREARGRRHACKTRH